MLIFQTYTNLPRYLSRARDTVLSFMDKIINKENQNYLVMLYLTGNCFTRFGTPMKRYSVIY